MVRKTDQSSASTAPNSGHEETSSEASFELIRELDDAISVADTVTTGASPPSVTTAQHSGDGNIVFDSVPIPAGIVRRGSVDSTATLDAGTVTSSGIGSATPTTSSFVDVMDVDVSLSLSSEPWIETPSTDASSVHTGISTADTPIGSEDGSNVGARRHRRPVVEHILSQNPGDGIQLPKHTIRDSNSTQLGMDGNQRELVLAALSAHDALRNRSMGTDGVASSASQGIEINPPIYEGQLPDDPEIYNLDDLDLSPEARRRAEMRLEEQRLGIRIIPHDDVWPQEGGQSPVDTERDYASDPQEQEMKEEYDEDDDEGSVFEEPVDDEPELASAGTETTVHINPIVEGQGFQLNLSSGTNSNSIYKNNKVSGRGKQINGDITDPEFFANFFTRR
ncbi:hypothetical protein I203_102411 [Kwoniella mangroviensis CBS 8507]|uniref:uncharacterized protein n=1 Tax=Kwoniella mangroviensis CBS 8507 TaxID=1296122 RepID=UPI00080D308A|nr:uncharacterized protein I203_06531 [Kwoniella mangroviensis CBS 8507]OCF64350.1 hypothetical protein I203_06531 [Kwoniella mangroviensis CBS 8507]